MIPSAPVSARMHIRFFLVPSDAPSGSYHSLMSCVPPDRPPQEIVTADDEQAAPEDSATAIIPGAKIFIPLRELIDVEKETARLTKELENIENELKRVGGKLANEGFVSKAPQRLIDQEREKLAKYEELRKSTAERLEKIKAMKNN